MDLSLKNKVALVTGGSRGLGKAVCWALAAEGGQSAINYLKHDATEKANALNLAQEIGRTFGVKAIPIGADITQESDCEAMFDAALAEFERVDILVNNAGIWPTSLVKEMSRQEWDRTLAVNLTGPFMLCRRMTQHLIATNRPGKIINVVSQAAFHGSTSGHAHYAAAKAGLVALTVSLAREVAEYGINVNAVAPGMMVTPMSQQALEQRMESYLERIPLGRIAQPDEVAQVIVFLASENANYITGATLDVTGGMLMR